MKWLEYYKAHRPFAGLTDPALRPIMALGLVASVVLVGALAVAGEVTLRWLGGDWRWGTLITLHGLIVACIVGALVLAAALTLMWCTLWTVAGIGFVTRKLFQQIAHGLMPTLLAKWERFACGDMKYSPYYISGLYAVFCGVIIFFGVGNPAWPPINGYYVATTESNRSELTVSVLHLIELPHHALHGMFRSITVRPDNTAPVIVNRMLFDGHTWAGTAGVYERYGFHLGAAPFFVNPHFISGRFLYPEHGPARGLYMQHVFYQRMSKSAYQARVRVLLHMQTSTLN